MFVVSWSLKPCTHRTIFHGYLSRAFVPAAAFSSLLMQHCCPNLSGGDWSWKYFDPALNKAASRSRQCFAIIQWYQTQRNKDAAFPWITMMLHLLLEWCWSSVRCYNQSSGRQNHLTLNSIKEFDCYHLPHEEPPQAVLWAVWKLHYLITDHSRDDSSSLLSLQIIFCCFLIILSSSTFHVFLSALFKYFCIGVLGHLSEAGRKTRYERATVRVSSAAPLLCTQLH